MRAGVCGTFNAANKKNDAAGGVMSRTGGAASLSAVLASVAVLAVAGCSTLFPEQRPWASPAGLGLATDVPETSADTAARRAAMAGIKALDAGKLDEASKQFNLALKLEISRSELQFLNGLAYHLMAVNGDESKYALAAEGYRLALKFDPSNWAAEYFLGLASLDQRKFGTAEASLVRAAIRRPDDPNVLYDLARAAYYAGDPRTADAALAGILESAPARANAPKVLRALSVTKAALDQREEAKRYLASYQSVAADPAAARWLARRVDDWRKAYDLAAEPPTPASAETAQFPDTFRRGPPTPAPAFPAVPGAPFPGAAPGLPGAFPGQPGAGRFDAAFFDPNMVVVDVVLIGVEEDRRRAFGVNLLNGLQLQFGEPLGPTPGFSLIRNTVKDLITPSSSVSTRTITRNIQIPSVTYTLNIANSLDSKSEILARPSLVALAGQTSEFFSGTDVAAAAVSGGQGDSVSIQKEVGVKLKVTPDFLPDNLIRLNVAAERTFLTDPSRSVVFQFRLDTTKTTLNATVAMKFGETLILGGLSERENSETSDGVPILKSIPGINTFFTRDVERSFERSILILLTPRRAQYGARSAEDEKLEQEKLNEFERMLERFEKRHEKWFLPRKTFDRILERLKGSEFGDEFRTGDIETESWHRRHDLKEKIGEIVDRVFAG
jgi:general secretion pathway protein D